jgi:predicted dehydrogenase
VKLRFGIVGCGAISEEVHLPTLVSCEDVELVAAIDSDLGQATTVAARHGCAHAGTEVASLAGKVDAIVLSTPPHVRPRLAEEALSLGIHVLAEKPLANSTRECRQMVAAAASSGHQLAVTHMFRFYPVRARMWELVERHRLGAIARVELHEGAPYSWQPRSGYTFRRELVSGGVLANAGIHSLDTFIDWFGDAEVLSYEDDAIGGLESNVKARMRFAQGIEADFRISRTCRLPSLFRIQCEHGELEFSNRDTVDYRLRDGRGTSAHRLEDPASRPADCWRAQLGDFIDCIQDGKRPRTDATEATRVVKLVEDMYALKQQRALPALAPVPGATW